MAFHRDTKWTTCTLSGAPLAEPVVADLLGSLYNKAAVLEFLLGRGGTFADEQAKVCVRLSALREGEVLC